MHNTASRSRRSTVAILAASCALLVASGPLDGLSPTSAALAPATAPPGDPVTIYYLAAVGTPVADYVEIPAAIKAAADAINARGGLNGHEIQLHHCNDTDANAEIDCARQATSEGALAFVGSAFIYNQPAAQQVLADESIPNVAGMLIQSPEFSVPVNFPIIGAPLYYPTCLTSMPAVTGKSTMASINNELASSKTSEAVVAETAERIGADYVGTVETPTTQTDYSSTVQQIVDMGAEIVFTSTSTGGVLAFIAAALQVGQDFSYCGSGLNAAPDLLSQFGPDFDDYYVTSSFPALSEAGEYPVLQQFVDEMAAAVEAGDEAADMTHAVVLRALNAWLGMYILEQVANSMSGELNNETLLAALNEAQVDFGGMIPTVDFSQPRDEAGWERAFNSTVYLQHWNPETMEFDATEAEPEDALELILGG